MNNDKQFSFEGEYSLEKLVERAVHMARPHCYRKLPRWVGVRDVFGWGSTTSTQLCQHFGLNPHEEVEGIYPQDDCPECGGKGVAIDSWDEETNEGIEKPCPLCGGHGT